MKIQLRKPINESYSGKVQVLTNRGLRLDEIEHYLNTTDADINDYAALGLGVLEQGARALTKTIADNKRALVVVDCDCDGYTSAALFINYMHDQFPAWVENNLDWFIHSGKQHGLEDLPFDTVAQNYAIVIMPDASSNDYEYHQKLADTGVDILVLDHHHAAQISPSAIVINNQLCDYPNKALSGVGIVWQFCRYLDSLLNTNYAQRYLDLVALGQVSDMMSLLSMETHHLVVIGFKPENIRNPFISTIARKNAYSLGDHINPHGAGWYIAPFINAMCRSGEQEEKEILFKSMLNHYAHIILPSTKRGHKDGDTEYLVAQALRVVDRVKDRQDKMVNEAISEFETMIKENNLLDHKVLLFLLQTGQISPNIAGLAANKFQAKYQRPCCILTMRDGIYEGSARGCDSIGVGDFKSICEQTEVIEYAEGHPGAFGLGLHPDNIQIFLDKIDAALRNISIEPVYLVDYIYNYPNEPNEDTILSISELDDYYGKDLDESYIAIINLKVTQNMVNIYVKKNNTLKINLKNGVSCMLFNAPDDLCDELRETEGYVTFNIIGKCAKNEFNGNVNAQIKIEHYEIINRCKYIF